VDKICTCIKGFPAIMIFLLSQTFSTAVPNTRLAQLQHTSWWNTVFYCWIINFLGFRICWSPVSVQMPAPSMASKASYEFTHFIHALQKRRMAFMTDANICQPWHSILRPHTYPGALLLPPRQFLVRLCYYSCRKLKI